MARQFTGHTHCASWVRRSALVDLNLHKQTVHSRCVVAPTRAGSFLFQSFALRDPHDIALVDTLLIGLCWLSRPERAVGLCRLSRPEHVIQMVAPAPL